MTRPAEISFYVDEDTLGLAKILCLVRPDVTYPGDPGGKLWKRTRPPCDVERSTVDPDWLPTVAQRGWLVLSRDRRLMRRTAEVAAIRDNHARVVTIGGRNDENLNNFQILRIVMTQWDKIEQLRDLPGPFVYSVSRSSLTKLL